MSAYESLAAMFGGFFVFILAIIVVVYVIGALATARVLSIYGYKNTWMAWIPYLQHYALADAVSENKENMKCFSFDLPSILFKIWWIIPLAISWFLPETNVMIINIIQALFLGTVYGHAYARIEGKTYKETQILGLVSGYFTIVAIIKFLSYDKNKKLTSNIETNSTIESNHNQETL